MEYLLVQQYTFFLFSVMVIAGIMKEYNLLSDVFSLIYKKVKSKRLVLFFISLVSGILPIPGRVTISASILNAIASNDKESRSKFGIIDYLSTHHYYLWSPLEKTVILPMAILGITWSAFISLVYPLILITIFYIIWYNFYIIKEEDIVLDEKKLQKKHISYSNILLNFIPFIIAIGFIGFGFNPPIVFGVLLYYYLMLVGYLDINFSKFNKVVNNINWFLLGVVSTVLIFSTFFKSYNGLILETLSSMNMVLDPFGLFLLSSMVFVFAWFMGSSSKYAGIVSLLVSIYGINYLVWFLVVEFFAYNVSPTHKCIAVGTMYFGTSIKKYLKVILFWQFLLLLYGFYTVFPFIG